MKTVLAVFVLGILSPTRGPNPSSDWEDDLNRPVASRNGGRYQMWSAGQVRGHAGIGHATSQDGRARQRMSTHSWDGITRWERRPANPLIRRGEDIWDHDAVFKPYEVLEDRRWLLWYNGLRADLEHVRPATHEVEDFGCGNR